MQDTSEVRQALFPHLKGQTYGGFQILWTVIFNSRICCTEFMYCAIYRGAKSFEQKERAHTFSVLLHRHTGPASRSEVPMLVRCSSSHNEPFQQSHTGCIQSSRTCLHIFQLWCQCGPRQVGYFYLTTYNYMSPTLMQKGPEALK